jgi:hypothetical protein
MTSITEYQELVKKIGMEFLSYAEEPINFGCSGTVPLEASDEQRYAALVLHWLRTKKKSLDWCRKASCYPSPKGIKARNMMSARHYTLWLPGQSEMCQAHIELFQSVMDEGGKSHIKCTPYAWWKHCKSYEHCLYLLVHKPHHFYKQLSEPSRVPKITAALMFDCVPVLANENDLVISEFFKDWCSGNVPKITDVEGVKPIKS